MKFGTYLHLWHNPLLQKNCRRPSMYSLHSVRVHRFAFLISLSSSGGLELQNRCSMQTFMLGYDIALWCQLLLAWCHSGNSDTCTKSLSNVKRPWLLVLHTCLHTIHSKSNLKADEQQKLAFSFQIDNPTIHSLVEIIFLCKISIADGRWNKNTYFNSLNLILSTPVWKHLFLHETEQEIQVTYLAMLKHSWRGSWNLRSYSSFSNIAVASSWLWQ